jgi:hypothetical protein
MQRTPVRKLKGSIAGLYQAGMTDFVSAPVDYLDLDFAGIAGDGHGGLTRRSGGREPWYKRGTEMRNERQLSLLAPDELQVLPCLNRPPVCPHTKPIWPYTPGFSRCALSDIVGWKGVSATYLVAAGELDGTRGAEAEASKDSSSAEQGSARWSSTVIRPLMLPRAFIVKTKTWSTSA